MDARVREDHFVDEDGGRGGHGGRDVGEDGAAFVVRPVVEDEAEVVEFGAWVGYRVRERRKGAA